MRRMLFFLSGLVFGLLVAAPVVLVLESFLSLQLTSHARKMPEETVRVMVASRSLPVGHVIHENDLLALELPPRFLPPGAYFTPAPVVGRVVRAPIVIHEYILAQRLEAPRIEPAEPLE